MKLQLLRFVGLVAVSYSAVLLAERFRDSSAQTNCNGGGNGACDDTYNNKECDYDKGDCCEESCVDGQFVCGSNGGFSCLDPRYRDDEDPFQELSYSYSYWCGNELGGNGHCDDEDNNEECDYDGGDCCGASCVDGEYTCGSNGGFDCLDPDYYSYFSEDEQLSYSHSSFGYELPCRHGWTGDGYCDDKNNSEECGYDGGDCCEESCVDEEYVCGEKVPFSCIDPDYLEEDDDPQQSSSHSVKRKNLETATAATHEHAYEFSCREEKLGNGYCNPGNNNEECGYDGGDCCYCTCPIASGPDCGGIDELYTCIDPTAPCLDRHVDAGGHTAVTVSFNGFDDRPGEAAGDSGCKDGGCRGKYTRDHDFDDEESRWSCRESLVPFGDPCEITFHFEKPVDVEYVQVAFWRADERSRTLQVTSNGVDMGYIESSSESTFTAFGMHEDAVETLTLTTSGLDDDEWIDLLEVRFMIEDPYLVD